MFGELGRLMDEVDSMFTDVFRTAWNNPNAVRIRYRTPNVVVIPDSQYKEIEARKQVAIEAEEKYYEAVEEAKKQYAEAIEAAKENLHKTRQDYFDALNGRVLEAKETKQLEESNEATAEEKPEGSKKSKKK